MSSSPIRPSSNRTRVKLYTLNEERQWDDRGTGFVTFLPPTASDANYTIIVKSEINDSILLESKIQLHTNYQKQQENLIVWSEGEKYDLALSFQEKAGCDDLWGNICDVQGRDSTGSATTTNHATNDPTVYGSDDDYNESNDNYLSSLINLPPVESAHLHDILNILTPEKVRDPTRRDLIARAIQSSDYVRKLLDLFHVCEDLENIDSLHQLYDIIRSIFYLNKLKLFEIMFHEDYIMDIIGCFEYEPHLTMETKRHHREFLNQKATFKEVIPICNHELLAKIHQTYRIQYIQDAILPAPGLFEENLLSTMNNFLFYNKVEIVTLLYEDPKFLSQLFATLKDDNLVDEKRRNLMLFLKEFCVFSQTLQQQNRDNFFQALATHGILNVIQVMVNLDDATVKQVALDVFISIVECNPSMVREHMLQETQSTQDDDELLLNLVISEMQSDPDPELSGALNLLNYIKLLIDPENMIAVSTMEKTEFLSFFYFRSMSVLLAPLMANTSDLKLVHDDFHTAQLQNLILDFLIFCIEHHTYYIKNFLQNKDLLKRVLVLLKSKHQFLQLTALRVIRRIIGLKDEQYNLVVVRNNLFAPIVDAFKANKRRYNLLNSAMIELFEFIRQENLNVLINYFVENFYTSFESVTYVKTFRELKSYYDSLRDRRDRILSESSPTNCISRFYDHLNPMSSLSMQRFRKDERELDAEEENWFNDDSDENKTSSLNYGTLFNDGSDDDDSQPEITSAISTSELPRSNHVSSDNDEDDDEIDADADDDGANRRSPKAGLNCTKPAINVSTRRSPVPSSSVGDLPESTVSRTIEPSSPYAMSPALWSIADQYHDDDDDDDDDDDENNSDSSLINKKRKLDNNETDDERNKILKL